MYGYFINTLSKLYGTIIRKKLSNADFKTKVVHLINLTLLMKTFHDVYSMLILLVLPCMTDKIFT